MTTPTTSERLEALQELCVYGPKYDRNVAVAVADARLFESRGQVDAFEHYTLLAEVRAGVIEWEDYVARDPFRAPQQRMEF